MQDGIQVHTTPTMSDAKPFDINPRMGTGHNNVLATIAGFGVLTTFGFII
jgi:hypothetical protein